MFEIAMLLLGVGGTYIFLACTVGLAMYVSHICSAPKEEREPVDPLFPKTFRFVILLGIEFMLAGGLLWLILGG